MEYMKILCEVVVSDVLPAVRSILTNELISNFNLTQLEVANKLGVTQPAVSQYLKGLRGQKVEKIISNKKLMGSIKRAAAEISKSDKEAIDVHVKMCEISEVIINSKVLGNEEVYPGVCFVARKGVKIGRTRN